MTARTILFGLAFCFVLLSSCDQPAPVSKGKNPQISGEDVEGNIIRLSDFKGKVVLVDFWGTWCGPCKMLEPRERSLKQMYRDQPFEILGIAIDSKPRLKAYLEKNPLPWPNIADGSRSLSDQYKIEAVPTFMLIDPEGTLIKTWQGGQNFDEIELAVEKAINDAKTGNGKK